MVFNLQSFIDNQVSSLKLYFHDNKFFSVLNINQFSDFYNEQFFGKFDDTIKRNIEIFQVNSKNEFLAFRFPEIFDQVLLTKIEIYNNKTCVFKVIDIGNFEFGKYIYTGLTKIEVLDQELIKDLIVVQEPEKSKKIDDIESKKDLIELQQELSDLKSSIPINYKNSIIAGLVFLIIIGATFIYSIISSENDLLIKYINTTKQIDEMNQTILKLQNENENLKRSIK